MQKPDAEREQELSIGEKAAALVFPGFKFGIDDPAQAERLVLLGVGGFCLYGGRPREIADFVRALQAKARTPLLFAADYEDGVASQVPGGTELPTNMGLGASGSEEAAAEKARITAREARALGVRWIYAPVVDLATEPDNPIVNVRAFGSDPALAGRMARAYCAGLKSEGALSCVKHFPGHGETREDSHLSLPVVRRTREQLGKEELAPYRDTLSADSVMLAHLCVPALGDAADLPTSLSKDTLAVLRRELGYDGLVLTDALSMNAVAQRFSDEDASVLALSAGADILLVPSDAVKLCYALPGLVEGNAALKMAVEAGFRRLRRAKAALGPGADAPEGDLSLLGCAAHHEAAARLAAQCLSWVRRPAKPLPSEVLYLEPDAESEGERQGQAFVEELAALGVHAKPFKPGEKGPLLAATFLRPRAWTGRIRWEDEERKALEAALAGRAEAILVSFGSPFVFDQASGWTAGLAAFSGSEASQRAAARVLAGKAEATGKLPVRLKASDS